MEKKTACPWALLFWEIVRTDVDADATVIAIMSADTKIEKRQNKINK